MIRMASHSAVSNLAIASLDMYRVPERISVAVRSLHLSRTGPSHSIFFSFPAQGQKCWRDSYNKTQCGEQPCDSIPGYEPCPGEDFCCRASTPFTLNRSESLSFSSFLAQGQKCWRDSYNKTQCGEPPCDGKPGYEPCPGEDFCCRTIITIILDRFESLIFLLFQRKDSNAGATLTTKPNAAINLVIASLDTNSAMGRIIAAVRPL